MEEKLVKLLGKYRNDNPELKQIEAKCLSTFSKEELMGELKKWSIDGSVLCRIGGIIPLSEYLCRLVHYAMEMDTENPIPDPSTKEDGLSSVKKKKETSDAMMPSSLCVFSGRVMRAGGGLHNNRDVCAHGFPEVPLV